MSEVDVAVDDQAVEGGGNLGVAQEDPVALVAGLSGLESVGRLFVLLRADQLAFFESLGPLEVELGFRERDAGDLEVGANVPVVDSGQ